METHDYDKPEDVKITYYCAVCGEIVHEDENVCPRCLSLAMAKRALSAD